MQDLISNIKKMSPPTSFYYLGAHPILCAYFNTQDPFEVIHLIKSISNKSILELTSILLSIVKDPNYPHENTIWQFNDVAQELGMFLTYFQVPKKASEVTSKVLALESLISTIEIHCLTYPFIDLSYVENELDFLCDSEQSDIIQKYETPNPKEQVRPKPQLISTLIVPTLALGSLFIANNMSRG